VSPLERGYQVSCTGPRTGSRAAEARSITSSVISTGPQPGDRSLHVPAEIGDHAHALSPCTSGSRITAAWVPPSNYSAPGPVSCLSTGSSSHTAGPGGPGDGQKQGLRTGRDSDRRQGMAPEGSRDKPLKSISWRRELALVPATTPGILRATSTAVSLSEKKQTLHGRSRLQPHRQERLGLGGESLAKITCS